MNILTTAKTFLIDKGPFITTALAVGGVTATAISAAKAAPNYKSAIDEAMEDESEYGHKFTKKQKAKIFVKHFGPTIIIASATAGLMGATLVLCEKKAGDAIGGLAAAYALSETKVKDMLKAQKEELSKKEQDAVNTNVMRSELKRSPISEEGKASVRGTEKMLVKCAMTGAEKILTAADIMEANLWLHDQMALRHGANEVPLSDLLDMLGMDTCDISNQYVFSYRFDEDPVKLVVTGDYDDVDRCLYATLDYEPRPTNTNGYY